LALRIVQIGMGGWGLLWGEVVRRSAKVELAACVDMSPAALAQAQRRLEVSPERCFASLEEAFASVEADAVLITASLAGHVPAALAALAAGKHVLLEKPFAPSLAEARRVVEAAEAHGLVLMVSQNYRFFPAVRAVAALVRAGTLGPVGMVGVDFRRYANGAAVEGNRHYTLRHPLLLDMAVHHFDLMRMLLGREPNQVTCHAWNPPWSKFAEPAAAAATITFDDEVAVSYRGSWVSPAPQTPWAGVWRMECAGGEILWTSRDGRGDRGDRVTVRPLGKPARRVELPALPDIDTAGSLAAFADAVRTGQPPESSGRDNLGTLALTHAAIESAQAGLAVPVAHVQ
jgi:predicted dehydrogenase